MYKFIFEYMVLCFFFFDIEIMNLCGEKEFEFRME